MKITVKNTTGLPWFYLCGGCEHYHPFGWIGDCRVDEKRYSTTKLERIYGNEGESWLEVNEETGERS